jgi:hypothetical protein
MEEAGAEPAVIGDLIETYSQRQNARWFWRQAIGASMPSPLNALRWAIAIPLAFRISVRLAGLVVGSVGSWGKSLAPYNMSIAWSTSAFGMFVFTAALVSIASLIVPTRRKLVARTLFGVVILVMGMMIVLPPAFGRSFDWTPRIIGAAGLLGGLISYVFVWSIFRLEAPRPTTQS